MNNVYLACGTRTPFAKAGTALKDVKADEMGRFALKELLSDLDLTSEELADTVDEVIVGNTGTPPDAANIGRVVALKAGLPESVSAYTVHRNCASAMEAVAQAYLKVAAGEADVIVAGGTESMSLMPLMYNKNSVGFFARMMKAKTMGQKIKTLAGIPIGQFLKPRVAIMEGLTDPFCGLNMGQTAEVIANDFMISRKEQDEFAMKSHLKAVAAQEAGLFKDEISAMPIPPKLKHMQELDVGPRKGQSMEALAKMRPYFDRKNGTVTVANACPITDGAVMTIVASEEGLRKLGGLKALAKIKGYAFAGLDPKRMGLGPVFSTQKVMKKLSLDLANFDVVELNEAFAAQVIGCLRAFESEKFCQEHFGHGKMGSLDEKKLNPQGGAIALGHPVGATGARLVLTTALQMKKNGHGLGLATLCIGGGQGGAMVLENI